MIEFNVEARKESEITARFSSLVTAYTGVSLSVLFTKFRNEERRIRLQMDTNVTSHFDPNILLLHSCLLTYTPV